MKTLFIFFKKNIPLFLILLFQIPLILPFFHKGFFPSHDDVQVTRIFEMVQSLKFGDIPPRWSANLLFGRGYPLYVFYGFLPYLIGSFFVFSGLNFLLATKAVFILSFFIGPIGVYLLVKEWWGKIPALTAAIAFSYAPYRAVDVFVRGNLGEFFSFSLFPLVFWLNLKLLKTFGSKDKKWWVFFCFSLFLLEISHNISCFIFFSFLLVFNGYFLIFLSNKKDKFKLVLRLSFIFLLATAMAAFYLVPLIYESKFVLVGQFKDSPYWEYFLTLKKLWNSKWGWGGYTDEGNAVSLQLGKSLVIFAISSSILNLFIKNLDKKLINFFTVCLVFLIFMEIGVSDVIWRNVSLLHYFQFPWRLHVLINLFLAILCGSLVYLVQYLNYQKEKLLKLQIALVIFFTFFMIFENLRLFKPRIYWNAPSVSETTTWNDEYLPKWVKIKPKTYTDKKIEVIAGKSVISEISWGYLQKKFVATSEVKSRLQIAHIYYPGWQVYVNGIKREIDYNNDYGLMNISIPKGKNEVVFSFERTWWRTASEAVSLFGFLIFILLSIKTFVSKRK